MLIYHILLQKYKKKKVILKRAIKLEKTTFQGWDSNLQALVWKMGAEPLRHYDSTDDVKYLGVRTLYWSSLVSFGSHI